MTTQDPTQDIERLRVQRERLEAKRKMALSSRDAGKYLELCVKLGVEPEDIFLAEQGELVVAQRQKESKLPRMVEGATGAKSKSPDYAGFLIDVRTISTPLNQFASYVETKKRLLRDYFPGRFGKGGKQDLGGCDNAQVGKLFLDIVNYAKKRLTRKRADK